MRVYFRLFRSWLACRTGNHSWLTRFCNCQDADCPSTVLYCRYCGARP